MKKTIPNPAWKGKEKKKKKAGVKGKRKKEEEEDPNSRTQWGKKKKSSKVAAVALTVGPLVCLITKMPLETEFCKLKTPKMCF